MNAQLFSFCLFLLWFGVALMAFVIFPLFYPKRFEVSQFLGIGAAFLAVWNFVKWWSLRQQSKSRAYRHELEAEYRRRTNPLMKPEEKPVLHPEFQFDESHTKIPPPPPPNGSAH